MKNKIQKKRILIIQESLGGGGAEKVLCGILNKFNYSIYDVTLLLWSKTGIYLDKLPKNVKIVCVFGQRHHFFEKLLFRTPEWIGDYVVEFFLKRLKIYSQRFDVIVSFLEGVSARLHSLMLNQGFRNISWVHIDMDKNRWSDRYFPYERAEKFYDTINNVVFVSEGAKTAFERVFKTGSRHSVIYNIMEPSEIRRMGSESIEKIEAKFTVCCTGRLVRQKRYDRVVRIAAILKNLGYEILFRIVGDGPLKGDLIRLVKEYGVEDMIELVGFQSNPYKYMSSADMFFRAKARDLHKINHTNLKRCFTVWTLC